MDKVKVCHTVLFIILLHSEQNNVIEIDYAFVKQVKVDSYRKFKEIHKSLHLCLLTVLIKDTPLEMNQIMKDRLVTMCSEQLVKQNGALVSLFTLKFNVLRCKRSQGEYRDDAFFCMPASSCLTLLLNFCALKNIQKGVKIYLNHFS